MKPYEVSIQDHFFQAYLRENQPSPVLSFALIPCYTVLLNLTRIIQAAVLFTTHYNSEQQMILGAFEYLTPSKFNQLGKIILLFFVLSKDTPQNEN